MPTAAPNAPLKPAASLPNCTQLPEVNQASSLPLRRRGQHILQFFWGSFCEWYLEIVKLRLDFSETAYKRNRRRSHHAGSVLKRVAPAFALQPFITEEIWHTLYDGNPPASRSRNTTNWK